MALNLKAIRKGVEKGINANPTNILLLRDNTVEDGYGGNFIDVDEPTIELANINILLDEATSSMNKGAYSDGGRKDDIQGVSALLLANDEFTLLVGDFFILGEKKYIVKYPLNMYGVYWSADLEVKLYDN